MIVPVGDIVPHTMERVSHTTVNENYESKTKTHT